MNSLFINVPLNKTINLIATKVYSEAVEEALKPPIRKIFVKSMKLATYKDIYKDKFISSFIKTNL